MYCVIQQTARKKPDKYGAYRELEAYQNQWRMDDKPYTWAYSYTGGRFERPHLEAYKITLHHSCREGGAVRKRQYTVCTMGYYDIAEYSLYDLADLKIQALAAELDIDPAALYDLVEAKLGPLRQRIRAEFHQSAEYQTHQKHERILADYRAAKSRFTEEYGVEGSDYDRCYDVFGVLRNKEYLAEVKARKQAEQEARKQSRRRYQEQWRGTYEQYTGGSYSVPSVSTYSEDERAVLKQFYRSLSKLYHPDLNPGKDTTAQMQVLNKLKEQWDV